MGVRGALGPTDWVWGVFGPTDMRLRGNRDTQIGVRGALGSIGVGLRGAGAHR